jgi:hypothetical protein
LTTDETGPSKFNLQQKMFDFSLENVHSYREAGERKNTRKILTEGEE